MKEKIFDMIMRLFYWIDDRVLKVVADYSYETQPYCGFHHSGYNGWFTAAHYHEGDGNGYVLTRLFFLDYCNIGGGDWNFIWFPYRSKNNLWIMRCITDRRTYRKMIVDERRDNRF